MKITKQAIEIPLPKLNKRQDCVLKTMIENGDYSDLLAYIASFKGKRDRKCSARYIRNNTRIRNIDELAIKEPGYYSDMFNALTDTGKSHRPDNKDLGQWIGVEIECCIPREALNLGDAECIIDCDVHEGSIHDCGCDHDCNYGDSDHELDAVIEYLNKHKIKKTSAKHDGSISPPEGYVGVELTVVFNRNDRSPLKKLCKVLNDLEATVNTSCGLHIHLDQRDLVVNGKIKLSKLATRRSNLVNALPLLFSMVPYSRRNNNYCRFNRPEAVSDRYNAINYTAFKKYKTIEVRLHSATTNYTKISNWIDLLLLIQSGSLDSQITNVSDLCQAFDVPERLIEYIEERVELFSDSKSVEPQTISQIEMDHHIFVDELSNAVFTRPARADETDVSIPVISERIA